MYKFSLILIIGLLFLHSQLSVFAADGDVDPYFLTGSGFNNKVRDIAFQQDEKLIIVGEFTFIVGAQRKYIARLKSNGNLDESFDPGTGTNGIIRLVNVMPDGKILIAGDFTNFNGAPAKKIALLNANGTLDSSFDVGEGPNQSIYAMTVQSDGKILVGGNFTFFNGVACNGIVRLNTDGSLDTTFPPLFDNFFTSTINAISVQPNGKILIGGSFLYLNGTAHNIARLEQNGSLDSTFQVGSGANSTVNSIAVQTDGTILVGGDFYKFNNIAQYRLAKLSSNGTLDSTFNVGTSNGIDSVRRIALQSDGKIFLIGTFSPPGFGGNKIMRLNADGTTDSSFTGYDSQTVNAVLFTSDDKIILGGEFSLSTGSFGASPAGVKRLNNDGSRDISYITRNGATGNADNIKIQPDGKILSLGAGVAGGLERFGLARLNTDGTVDEAYNPNVRGRVFIVQPDNKVVVGGIASAGNIFRFQRINQDGSIDPTYVADSGNLGIGINGEANVYDMVVQPDGKVIAVGSFELINGIARKGIVRLNTDGSVDTSFNANLTYQEGQGSLNKVRLLPDGRILIVARATYNGTWITSLFRFNADGTFDGTYNQTIVTAINSSVSDLEIQTDGKILIAGFFSQVNSYSIKNFARINSDGSVDTSFFPTVYPGIPIDSVLAILPQKDGKMLVSGAFRNASGASLNGLARLNPDGSFDSSFKLITTTVHTIAQESSGNLIIGGDISSIQNFPRSGIARLFNSLKSSAFVDFDGDGRADISVFRPSNGVWYLNQSVNGFTGIAFGQADDKLVPADYDGDGKSDVAVFRPSNGVWYLNRSSLGFTGIAFGESTDIPVPADYDGDGKDDIAVFRPSNGVWYLLQSTGGFVGLAFGQAGDKPVTADYDGDGKSDIAVVRNGTWYIQRSRLGFTSIAFGEGADKPVPADYDGDGMADIAVFRPSNGTWYLQQSTSGFTGIAFGAGDDLPVPADYDGDGKTDIAVFRPSNGVWYLNRSTQGFTGVGFGAASDKPVPNAFVQ